MFMSPPVPHINVEVLVLNIRGRQYGVIEVSWYSSTLNKGEGMKEIRNLPNIFDGGCSYLCACCDFHANASIFLSLSWFFFPQIFCA